MKNAIIDVPGIRVGHAQDLAAATGCTVILCEQGAVTGVDVRGGAPGTRETDALDPACLVAAAHAVYLGGGSAFGLDGAGGVMRYLEEKGIGFDAGAARVPIVPAAVLFDLAVGDARVRPDEAMGYRACQAASDRQCPQGNVGAGTGATVGKAAGMARCMKAGIGTASTSAGGLVVAALVALNCFGDVIDPAGGSILAGTLSEDGTGFADSLHLLASSPAGLGNAFGGNTTLGVVATNARLTKAGARRAAMMAQDGFARAIRPAHTLFDGDTVFCMATGEKAADLSVVGALAAEAMAQAILRAVFESGPLAGIKAYRDLARSRP